MQHMSGGPNTIVNLMYRLAAEGVPVRFLSCNTPLDSDSEPLWSHFQSISGVHRRLPNVEIADASSVGNPANIGENDTFVASAWWTAQMILSVLPMMRKSRYWYIIQDFEPGLYPWNSEYALALETYSHDILPVFNTNLLRDYFLQNRIGRFADPAFARAALAFEPAVDSRYFAPEQRLEKRPMRLLFYARPVKAVRNMFEIGLAALELANLSGTFDSSPWEIRYIGDALPETRLSRNRVIRPVPWLGFESYARLMRQSDILLSLMLSPHPSYPPLEMAACGGLVVTNTFECKTTTRLAEYSPDILAATPTVPAVADALRRAVSIAQQRSERVRKTSILPADWSESFTHILTALVREWRDQHSTLSVGA
jgi:O-antigen biosynthesis protein